MSLIICNRLIREALSNVSSGNTINGLSLVHHSPYMIMMLDNDTTYIVYNNGHIISRMNQRNGV